MEVGYEDMRIQRTAFKFTAKLLPQNAKAGATVEDENVIAVAHLHAGGVASIAQVLGLWSGRGAAHAPKLNLHKPRY